MTTTVDDLVAQIPPERREQFSPTRYPYTYACDFMRQNPNIIPAGVASDTDLADRLDRHYPDGHMRTGNLMSRSEASSIRQAWARMEGRDDGDLARVLADAYLRVNGIVRTE